MDNLNTKESVGQDMEERKLEKARRYSAYKKLMTFSIILLSAAILAIIIFICVVATAKRDSSSEVAANVVISKEDFGATNDGKVVHRFTFKNKNGAELQVITFGGSITSIKIPDKDGKLADVIVGYDDLNGYLGDGNRYFGALVGRVANRIGAGRFVLDGVTYSLQLNNGPNHLHGGPFGWSKYVWSAEQKSDRVVLSHVSPDGDENYPGRVTVAVTIMLTDDNQVVIIYQATVDGKGTPINLTSHPYFNLAGQGTGTIYDHEVIIKSDAYLPVSDTLIPTGNITDVNGTVFDLRVPRRLGDVIDSVPGGGFDHCYVLRGPTGKRLAARIRHPASGRVMEVITDQPGMQFYTGNFLDLKTGKGGKPSPKHSAFCMETQNFPDAINHKNFPDCVLRSGSTYEHYCSYKFSVDRN